MLIHKEPESKEDVSLRYSDFDGFPFYIAKLSGPEDEEEKYLAYKVTTVPPDSMQANVLALFKKLSDLNIAIKGLNCKHASAVMTDFETARSIAINKSDVHGLGIQEEGKTVFIHWIR